MRIPKFNKKNTLIAFVIIIISIVAQFIIPEPTKTILAKPTLAPQNPIFTKVTRVIDGDTIEIEGGKKVRYIGIDTPELHHPTKVIQCFAKEAFEKNKELLENKTVKLVKDVSETDRYGRLLRYVYLENQNSSSEAVFINKYLVDNGYAYVSTFPPDVLFADQFKSSQNQAMRKSLGLWRSCSITP